ncbi:MAG: 7-cyano-7-deazaguanine synthase QueC [Candidatus Coatesbacteria bacterium]|nr:MAG: 7-cyano-7-deazaguanine synthase QueC [Candidatus Coatesbacteria bacterium]
MNSAEAKSRASVILLSGGLDSAVNLAEAAARTEPALALTFDYGQRAAPREVKAAAAVAKHYGVRHNVIELPWFAELLPPAVAVGGPADADVNDESVWVPNRNGVFVAVGAAHAEALGASLLVTGFNAEEATAFPDNSAEYINAANRALEYSTKRTVELFSFTAEMTKADIVRRAVELNVPLDMVYSCYRGRKLMCGVCPSCRRTVAAMADAGVLRKYESLFETIPEGVW